MNGHGEGKGRKVKKSATREKKVRSSREEREQKGV